MGKGMEMLGKRCYTYDMYNWSTDEKKLQETPEKYAIWRLEQLINFGLNGERIKAFELKKYWSKLQLDPARKKLLELLLHES
ncbi:MAG: hypothetical protein HYZ08_00210 [Candidatus Kerfeldbacteria bacterium]|nr:hypothetical protein [Candidatus Kerfeldbacteria bacterium]